LLMTMMANLVREEASHLSRRVISMQPDKIVWPIHTLVIIWQVRIADVGTPRFELDHPFHVSLQAKRSVASLTSRRYRLGQVRSKAGHQRTRR
jgi:hypothetical protein